MNTQGITYILLKACQVNESQLLQLIQPFQGLFPANDAEYHALCTAMRRMGHIIERNPGNLASTLRGHAQSPNFFADTADQRLDPWSNTFMVNNTPHGNAQPPREMYTIQPPTPSYMQEWASWGPSHAERVPPSTTLERTKRILHRRCRRRQRNRYGHRLQPWRNALLDAARHA